MERTKELERFYQNLSQEIINKAAVEEEGQYRESIFTQIYIDYSNFAHGKHPVCLDKSA